uniref:NADH-ubiquinone oxidoreductase chain 6 n=1 Tax=Staphylinidae sp. BMNH 1274704 TaxID=1796597 RepID=A0A140EFT8_9COLE|nr:NADH dehydrogenase subunit 6 [Staphylinidae sp. BMNH 1274704]
MTYLLIMNFLFSIVFCLMNHPLSLGLTLLIQTIIISLITGIMSINFWFSYILFLIMVGGMLILFIYMTSIASNELFKFSSKTLLFLIFMLMIMMMIMFMLININQLSYFNFNSFMLSNLTVNFSLNKFINYPSNFIMFMMISYLLITLIAVVKIVNINSGPLRQKF